MPVKSDESSVRGDCKAVVIENEFLQLSVLPELGAKIYDIIHKGTGRNVLWHNPRIAPRRIPFGAHFDDVWSGGWDEIFPNDAESVVGSERFPDMGEAWALKWNYRLRSQRDSIALTTRVMTPISPVEIERRLTLRSGESGFTCDYTLRNLSRNEVKFLWKVHPAFEINGSCRIEIPAKVGIVDPRYAKFYSQSRYRWPLVRSKAGKKVDVSEVDPSRNDCTLHYLTGLSTGTAKFIDKRNGLESEITFDSKRMDNVWLFLAYGGWRGHYTAVIEPSTSYPFDLATAIRQGHYSSLPGKGSFTSSVAFEVQTIKKSQR
ncbi:MAG TPA: DUF5107 domain-containing protein [Nitrososphaerales archaeon]|nr:DUF5107 domain-containing protein [Nitrososphaerales archaeon]